jgi:hypothetical protein
MSGPAPSNLALESHRPPDSRVQATAVLGSFI